MDDQLLRFRINTNTANELAVFQDDLASMYTAESKKIKYLQEAAGFEKNWEGAFEHK
jgi:hypothetical protein